MDLKEHGAALDSYSEIDLAHPLRQLSLRRRYCFGSSDGIGEISCLLPLFHEVVGYGLAEGMAQEKGLEQGQSPSCSRKQTVRNTVFPWQENRFSCLSWINSWRDGSLKETGPSIGSVALCLRAML